MNLNPLIWISKKYLQEIVGKEIKPISSLTSKLEKENIGIIYKVEDHKERITKLEERLREYEIKIASYNTAIEVVKQLTFSNNSKKLGNE